MTSKLTISFQSPHAGWLPLRIDSGQAVAVLAVSYVPNDFLEELVNALLAVCQSEGSFVARVHEEPEEKIVRLTRHRSTASLTVERPRGGEALFKFEGSVADVVLPIWRALRRLETDPQLGEWRRAFPVSAMEQFGKLVERLKTPAA